MQTEHSFSPEKLPAQQAVESATFKPDTTLSSHLETYKEIAMVPCEKRLGDRIGGAANLVTIAALRTRAHLDRERDTVALQAVNDEDYDYVAKEKLQKAA